MKVYLSFLLLSLSFSISAQRFDSVLKKLNTEYPQERMYLQFDRSIYNPGETIWFKAYLFSGIYPSSISKTLYFELTDSKGKVYQRVTAPVIISSASGALDIPINFSGKLIVRAYTKWMLNFDSSFLFTKAFVINTPRNHIDKTSKSPANKISNNEILSSKTVLNFFPEGGDLVLGIQSRVAFKVTDQNGMPENISGDIVNNKGAKITSFSTGHAGMGLFFLRPNNDEKYKAVWKDALGNYNETILPNANENGLVLEVDNLKNQIEFNVKRKPDSDKYPFVYVVAQMNQQEIYKAKVKLIESDSVSGLIRIENFPAGIVQVTVFTPDEKPIAERIVFANPEGYSFPGNLDIKVKDLIPRAKNEISIEIPDTIASNLSVSITDADLNSGVAEDNIYSHLLLTSDIKGYVYDPAYYFTSDADSVVQHLDLVMMTNGWRRFKWENVLAGNFPTLNFLPENYLAFHGQVKGINKKLFSGEEITGVLETRDKKKEYLNTTVDLDGKFNISGMIFYDSANLFYQFNKDKNKKLTSRADFDIKTNLLDEPLNLQPGKDGIFHLITPDSITLIKNENLNQMQFDALENQKLKTLKTVIVSKKNKTNQELMDEEYTSGMFSDGSGNSRTIIPDGDASFLNSRNLLDYLQSRVAGMQVNPTGNEDAITWHGSATALFVDEIAQMSFTSTGQIVQDASYILSLPMSEIAMVKIYNPPFMGAWGAGPGGAVAVYLKKPKSGNARTKGLNNIIVAGYTPVREFYSPNYSLPQKTDVADYRATLLWIPFVLTDKNHQKTSLSFYNNDITKKIKIIVEGCNEDGKLVRIEKIY